MATSPQKAPTGVMMMIKALGVDPKIFEQVAAAVQQIADALGRIEAKQNKILELLEGRKGEQ